MELYFFEKSISKLCWYFLSHLYLVILNCDIICDIRSWLWTNAIFLWYSLFTIFLIAINNKLQYPLAPICWSDCTSIRAYVCMYVRAITLLVSIGWNEKVEKWKLWWQCKKERERAPMSTWFFFIYMNYNCARPLSMKVYIIIDK